MNIIERLHLYDARPTKKLILLGASGSIGKTTLEVLRRFPEIQLDAVSVHRSIDILPALIREFLVRHIAITHPESYEKFMKASHYPGIKFYKGQEGLIHMLHESSGDTVLNALVGSSGLLATMETIYMEKKLCIANKESLIIGGELLEKALRKYRAPVIPVDSEHNATFQLLQNISFDAVEKIILTASGGPFRDKDAGYLHSVKKNEVLNHPTWQMGPKITVDSASMINKGLEVIEAHYLFGIPYESIEVKIHKESYVHALLQLKDGSFLMAASPPSMVFPVANSLLYPEFPQKLHREYRKLEDWPALQFFPVDAEKYPGFFLCLEAGKKGKSAPVVLNASNEAAVELFLDDKIRFVEIPVLIRKALDNISLVEIEDVDNIIRIDREVKDYVLQHYQEIKLLSS